jgi:hypothetical protein
MTTKVSVLSRYSDEELQGELARREQEKKDAARPKFKRYADIDWMNLLESLQDEINRIELGLGANDELADDVLEEVFLAVFENDITDWYAEHSFPEE